jgi:hypothetical protein
MIIIMTRKEVVRRTLRFQTPERYAHEFPEAFGGDDIVRAYTHPSPDGRPRQGTDAWGCVWECLGDTNLGEVKVSPLKDWKDFDKLPRPDISREDMWDPVRKIVESAGDKYVMGAVSSIFERFHFVRGFNNALCDVLDEKENVRMFIDLLVDINIKLIESYAKLGVDGIISPDDWGLQDRLMINPVVWRELWKPGYKRMYDAAHQHGMDAWLHSCGYIIDILGDLVEVGLDVIEMHQQENMGLKNLGDKFRGKVTFLAPVDIQSVMPYASPDEIRAYCHEMAKHLGTKKGGFIPQWYADPVGAGHTMENVGIMCEEFTKISK